MRTIGKSLLVYALSGMLIAPMPLISQAAQAGSSGTVYQGDYIYTMSDTMEQAKDPSHKANTAQMVITENGKIVYVGDSASAPQSLLAGKKVVELGDKAMLPGFVDGHGHYPGYATTDLFKVNLYPTPIGDCDTLATIQSRIATKAIGLSAATPSAPVWVFGDGYDDTLLTDIGRHPTADELSTNVENGANVYVYIKHISGHMGVVNRKYADDLLGNGVQGKTIKVGNDTLTIESASIVNNVYTLYYTNGTNSGNYFEGAVVKDHNGTPRLDGLLNEIAAMSLATIFPEVLSTKEKNTRQQLEYQYASRSYAKAGVTTANQSFAFPSNLPAFRKYVAEGLQQVRLSMHPPVIANYLGPATRAQLAWISTDGQEYPLNNTGNFGQVTRQANIDENNGDVEGTRLVGEDLTRWSPGPLSYSGAMMMHPTGTPKLLESTDDLSARGESITHEQLASLPSDMFILGQYKILLDGSNQGYTGYFKSPGYYDKTDAHGHEHGPWDPLLACAPKGTFAEELWGLAGSINVQPVDLNTQVQGFHSQNQGTTIHANGSRANELVAGALERAVHETPSSTDTRHTIIHAQTEERQHTQRLVGRYDDVIAKENGTLPQGMRYENLEAFAHPENFGLFDEYLLGSASDTALRQDNVNEFGYGHFSQEDNLTTLFTEHYASKEEAREKVGAGMKAQNIVSSYFVDHTFYWGDRHKNVFMGPGRANQISPIGWAVAYDHYFTTHNDTPIVAISPLRSTESAVTRIPYGKDYALTGSSKDMSATVEYQEVKNGEMATFWDYDQRATVLQGLLATTRYAAFSIKADDRLGSIEVGKYADFVILDQDPFSIDSTAIADIRVTATIVADEVVYGVLPGSTVFAQNVEAGITQSEATMLATVSSTELTDDQKNAYDSQVTGNAKIFGTHAFTAEYSPAADGQVVTFQMDILGNGMKVSDLELHKITSNTDYEKYTYAETRFGDGTFWIVEDNKPLAPLASDAVLEMNKYYILFFSIADNGKYDVDSVVGQIEDPVRLVSTSGTLPTNSTATSSTADHGSSGGCTVGTEPMYDMMLLFFAGLGLIVFRSVKRKED